MREVAKTICKIKSDLKGAVPLHVAAWNGNLEVFQYLFEDSLDKNSKNET